MKNFRFGTKAIFERIGLRGRELSRLKGSPVLMLFLIVVLLGLPYGWYPVYEFEEGGSFGGEKIYNPYQGTDSLPWLRANLHAHTKSWGGLTNGQGSEVQLRAVYDTLGYDVVGISNYHHFSDKGWKDSIGFNLYEHGYGLLKNHYLVVGSPRVYWFDAMLSQPLSLRQYIIDLLNSDAQLLFINHPGFSRSMDPAELKMLGRYDGMEVVNRYGNSFEFWDSVLSVGKPVYLFGNDDVHNAGNWSEVARKITYIQSPANSDSIYAAVKAGRTLVFESAIPHTTDITSLRRYLSNHIRLLSFRLSGDTLRLRLSRQAKSIRFIGQHGQERQKILGQSEAIYPITATDTYIRTEIMDADGSLLHLNPVFRYSETVPPIEGGRIHILKTNLKRVFFLILVLYLLVRLHRAIVQANPRISIRQSGFSVRHGLTYLLIVSTLIRLFLAGNLELGNDEVYYLSYARYPDLSHFDHPPMVGWLIQFFTLQLKLNSSLFIRLASVLFGTLNTLLIFNLGRKIKNETAGFIAAMLYTCSVYGFVVSGVFILPDTPQVLFWILSLHCLFGAFQSGLVNKSNRRYLLAAGFCIGLAMISKYTSVFLWVAALGYIAIRARHWIGTAELYAALFLSFLMFFPVLFWNLQNDFSSFSFQSERVAFTLDSIRFDLFFTELIGQVFYSNPINFLLYFLALFAFFRSKKGFVSNENALLLLSSLPLILIFLFFALFRKTLPHWSGPGYISLLLFSSVYFSDIFYESNRLKRTLQGSAYFILVVVVLGYLQINFGLFRLNSTETGPIEEKAKFDLTADMYGWERAAEQVAMVLQKDKDSLPFVHFKWFPGAHIDHYICRPLNRIQYMVGSIENTHKYHWIYKNNPLPLGSDAWYLTNGKYHTKPEQAFGSNFQKYQPMDTIPIFRDGVVVNYFFLYKCQNFQSKKLD